MFDKIKQIKKLKKIQKELKREKMDVEKNGIVVTINGSIQIEISALTPIWITASRKERSKIASTMR